MGRAQPAETVPLSITDPRRLRVLRTTGLLDSAPEDAFDRTTRLAARLLRTPAAAVTLVDAKRQFFKSALGLAEPWASERETPLEYSLCRQTVARAKTLAVVDGRTDQMFSSSLAVKELGVVAYLGVPLVVSGAPLGALCVSDVRARAWTEDDVRTLEDLAASVAVEIELRLNTAYLKLMQQVATAANRAPAPEDAMRACLDGVCSLMGWPVGHVFTRQRTPADEMVPTTVWRIREGDQFAAFKETTEKARLPRGVGLVGKVLATASPVWIADVSRDEAFSRRAAAEACGLRASFAFPVLVGDDVAAVLEFYSEHAEAPDEALLDVMQRVGEELGRAVERERATEALRASEAYRRRILDSAHDAFIAFDRAGRIVDWNAQAAATFGWSRDKAIGRFYADLLLPEEEREERRRLFARFATSGETVAVSRRLEFVCMHRDGRKFPVEVAITAVGEGEGLTFTAFIHDITERRAAADALRSLADELRELSLQDALTGLYNRRGFTTLVEQQLRIAERERRPLLLLYIDLDGLKDINDRLGHKEGDRAITDAAAVLRETFRGSDIVARLGGDEFAVFLTSALADPGAIPSRLQAAVDRHNATAERPYVLAMSVGVVTSEAGSAETLDSLLARADAVMYERKRSRATGRHVGFR